MRLLVNHIGGQDLFGKNSLRISTLSFRFGT